MMTHKAILVRLLVIWCGINLQPKLAFAEPLIFSCTFREASGTPSFISQADRLLIDPLTKSVDFQVARTVGSLNPMNWFFTATERAGGSDRFVLELQHERILGAGLRGGTPHSLRLENGVLTWVFVTSKGAEWVQWNCEEEG